MSAFTLHAQLSERFIYWEGQITSVFDHKTINLLDFKNSIYNNELSSNRLYFEKIPTDCDIVSIDVIEQQYETVSNEELNSVVLGDLKSNFWYDYNVRVERKQKSVYLFINPFRNNNGVVEKLISFKLRINPCSETNMELNNFVENSVLNSGSWYKIGVTQSGVHELDIDFLNNLNINVSSLDPRNIRLYGNQAGMLHEGNDLLEIDDLKELSIQVLGEDDGLFDINDKVLFYGQSPHTWTYDNDTFVHEKNIYTDTTYYFISFDLGPGKRILNEANNTTNVNDYINSYDEYYYYENDLINLVNTGRQWFGEAFAFNPNQSFNYNATKIDLTESVQLTMNFAARSSIGTSFNVNINSNDTTAFIPYVSSNSNSYYKSTLLEQEFNPSSGNLNLSLNYNNSGNTSALAWLDYYRLVFRNKLIFDGQQFIFRDAKSVNQDAISRFSINFPLFTTIENIPHIWDVTDPLNVHEQDYTLFNDSISFIVETTDLREFLIFNKIDNLTPSINGLISNQNIHNSEQPSYIIITHPLFYNAANRLADYYRNNNELVLLCTTEQVYNEFSTGSVDVSAIRNLIRMFYNRAQSTEETPKNVLLFGDASFDYKNITYTNSSFVPTYQSYVSNSIETSYCTDDYFGVLDFSEGNWDGGLNSSINSDLIDIGVGRIPVTSLASAESFVDKVLLYNQNSEGAWKNNVCFVADDADANWEDALIIHADALANKIDTAYNSFNVKKVYLDSYSQSLSSGAQRYPEAQADLIRVVEEGVFIVTYVGHGGEIGWASERVLELSDINNFSNINKLPLFITATCEFTRYDDPSRVSAGELLLLNPNGGAMGLFSTSRTVSESSTYSLVDALYNYLPDQDLDLTLGEVLRHAKNDPTSGSNIVKRKFSFFGDPNIKLSFPKFNIETTGIELLDSIGNVIDDYTDTINALSHVKLDGQVTNNFNEIVSDFNGELFVTVFDKEFSTFTLNNDGFLDVPFEYILQNNAIYVGNVDVVNGVFSLQFIVPKDISYYYGDGKISYYANDISIGDASGYDESLSIGGVSDYASSDLDGPIIQLFMNDSTFKYGGITSSNPSLLAVLFDDSGINTLGTGIGHDLTVILDDNTANQYILNNYYQADLNSYQSGLVSFPFSSLSEGIHTLTFKAWDVHNNSNSEELEFFVTNSEQLAIAHLLNYPNPCSSYTTFVFEHNRSDELLDVKIDIYSLDGKLVNRISKSVVSSGFREVSAKWNIDESIPKGIYLYKLHVQSQLDQSIIEKTEKLIILR